jgi:MFS family permease
MAYLKVPNPEKLEITAKKPLPDKLSKVFWLYTFFAFFSSMGFVNFVLMGYHFKAKNILTDAQIPLFYAIAMAVDAVAAVIVGKLYDVFKEKHKNDNAGLKTLIVIPTVSLIIPIFAFSRNLSMVALSVVLWGVVMGAHETIMKSAIADLTPLKKRGTGYGIFNTGYGLAVFIGSALMGVLYDHSILAVIILAMLLQVVAFFSFFALRREAMREMPV